MADYWKSQPRKFCQYCKCWIADNKPSIDFHERGKNHKENVAAKIAEIKKKSIDKAKQDERMNKQFAAMEEAAMKAYEEDLKRMQMEAAGITLPVRAPSQAQPQPLVQTQPKPKPKPQPKKQQKKGGKSNRPPRPAPTQVWVEGLSEDGHTYFYNTVTGESQWEKPESFYGHSSTSAQPQQNESSSGSVWMEALSPEGYTYYYNTETGESSWEKPADFPSDEASESNREGEEDESQEEAAAPELEQTSGGEESPDGAAASQQTEAPEPGSQQGQAPKISFRKRKAEADVEKEQEQDKASDDAPTEEMKKEEEVQSAPAEPPKIEEQVTQQETQGVKQAKRQRAANPYGAWEKIQQEVDPYEKVDLQLPQVEESTPSSAADLPPEPKPKFKERVITSLGEEGGPATFKKNKTQNGKSRSLRQRNDDD